MVHGIKVKFVLNTYKENLNDFLSSFNKYYNENNLLIISDKKERLKTLENGGAWTNRYLKKSLENFPNLNYLVLLDPETRFNGYKNFNYNYLNNPKVWSTFINNHLCGGCIVFNRPSIEYILQSRFLLNKKYTSRKFSYYWRSGKEILSCQDLILTDCLSNLNIPIEEDKDFSCYPKHLSKKTDKTRLIWH